MSDVEQWEHDEQRAMETEITTLREQVKKLKAELKSIDGALDDPRANLTLTTSEIIWELKGQVEKLTKERNALQDQCIRLKNERAVEKEQLAALAAQTEKYREALFEFKKEAEHYGETWARAHIADYDRIATDSKEIRFRLLGIAQDRLKAVGEAIAIPDLASPVLNRIRAEGVRKASTLVSLVRNDWASAGDNLSVQAAEYLISALDARAAELEKS